MADIYVKPRTSVPRGSVWMAPVIVLGTIGAIIVLFIWAAVEPVVNHAKKVFGKNKK